MVVVLCHKTSKIGQNRLYIYEDQILACKICHMEGKGSSFASSRICKAALLPPESIAPAERNCFVSTKANHFLPSVPQLHIPIIRLVYHSK